MSTKRFSEGVMSEDDWIRKYAESVEEYHPDWSSYYSRTKFNRMDGREQDEYMRQLKAKAAKPHFRAWRQGGEVFVDISKAAFDKYRNTIARRSR